MRLRHRRTDPACIEYHEPRNFIERVVWDRARSRARSCDLCRSVASFAKALGIKLQPWQVRVINAYRLSPNPAEVESLDRSLAARHHTPSMRDRLCLDISLDGDSAYRRCWLPKGHTGVHRSPNNRYCWGTVADMNAAIRPDVSAVFRPGAPG